MLCCQALTCRLRAYVSSAWSAPATSSAPPARSAPSPSSHRCSQRLPPFVQEIRTTGRRALPTSRRTTLDQGPRGRGEVPAGFPLFVLALVARTTRHDSWHRRHRADTACVLGGLLLFYSPHNKATRSASAVNRGESADTAAAECPHADARLAGEPPARPQLVGLGPSASCPRRAGVTARTLLEYGRLLVRTVAARRVLVD